MKTLFQLSRRFDGLTLLQIRMIVVVSRLRGISIATLGETVGVDERTAWENVRILGCGRGGQRAQAGLGLIDAEKNPHNKRACFLSLTDDGAKLAETLKQ